MLNCLITSLANRDLNPDERFVSRLSIATGLTFKLDQKLQNGVGLSDTKKREQAAIAINKALGVGDHYKIVFMVT